eukprot:MONOS_12917.1-p1 / transcript=MONOS_12917.1 / gene=MONOS_12917 / organism=Monocercomonoides_exilis_PA203 / gene_product=unspecified product / transcript_product=unspecified product / location=Mono_scaffold00752:10982-13350(+) / protein_length=771 / sequence_SO=supercontig / SO=protein_coding / is_pseudo=false
MNNRNEAIIGKGKVPNILPEKELNRKFETNNERRKSCEEEKLRKSEDKDEIRGLFDEYSFKDKRESSILRDQFCQPALKEITKEKQTTEMDKVKDRIIYSTSVLSPSQQSASSNKETLIAARFPATKMQQNGSEAYSAAILVSSSSAFAKPSSENSLPSLWKSSASTDNVFSPNFKPNTSTAQEIPQTAMSSFGSGENPLLQASKQMTSRKLSSSRPVSPPSRISFTPPPVISSALQIASQDQFPLSNQPTSTSTAPSFSSFDSTPHNLSSNNSSDSFYAQTFPKQRRISFSPPPSFPFTEKLASSTLPTSSSLLSSSFRYKRCPSPACELHSSSFQTSSLNNTSPFSNISLPSAPQRPSSTSLSSPPAKSNTDISRSPSPSFSPPPHSPSPPPLPSALSSSTTPPLSPLLSPPPPSPPFAAQNSILFEPPPSLPHEQSEKHSLSLYSIPPPPPSFSVVASGDSKKEIDQKSLSSFQSTSSSSSSFAASTVSDSAKAPSSAKVHLTLSPLAVPPPSATLNSQPKRTSFSPPPQIIPLPTVVPALESPSLVSSSSTPASSNREIESSELLTSAKTSSSPSFLSSRPSALTSLQIGSDNEYVLQSTNRYTFSQPSSFSSLTAPPGLAGTSTPIRHSIQPASFLPPPKATNAVDSSTPPSNSSLSVFSSPSKDSSLESASAQSNSIHSFNSPPVAAPPSSEKTPPLQMPEKLQPYRSFFASRPETAECADKAVILMLEMAEMGISTEKIIPAILKAKSDKNVALSIARGDYKD